MAGYYWREKGKHELRKKDRGSAYMVSGFMCACHGLAGPSMIPDGDSIIPRSSTAESPDQPRREAAFNTTLSTPLLEQWPYCLNISNEAHRCSLWCKRAYPFPRVPPTVNAIPLPTTPDDDPDTLRFMEPGVNKDGYWGGRDVNKHLQAVIPLLQRVHPNCDLVFVFDNSSTHDCWPPNALDANILNKEKPGKGPKHEGFVEMRQGWFIKDGERTVQDMQYPAGHRAAFHHKSIKKILEERGLWPTTGYALDCSECKKPMKDDPDRRDRTTCCARRVLASQPDFVAQRSMLEETAELLGARVIFLPKFHCELNPIEYLWGYAKKLVRMQSDGTRNTLLQLVPTTLRSCPLSTIRRWYARMWKMVFLYSQESLGTVIDARLCQYLSKKYKSHRDIPVFVGEALDTLMLEYRRS